MQTNAIALIFPLLPSEIQEVLKKKYSYTSDQQISEVSKQLDLPEADLCRPPIPDICKTKIDEHCQPIINNILSKLNDIHTNDDLPEDIIYDLYYLGLINCVLCYYKDIGDNILEIFIDFFVAKQRPGQKTIQELSKEYIKNTIVYVEGINASEQINAVLLTRALLMFWQDKITNKLIMISACSSHPDALKSVFAIEEAMELYHNEHNFCIKPINKQLSITSGWFDRLIQFCAEIGDYCKQALARLSDFIQRLLT